MSTSNNSSSNSNRNEVLLPPKPTATTNKDPARRSISTASYFLRSEWDQGVDILEDVIRNNTTLSDEQRQGLQQVQRLLLTKESRRQSYIPLELLQQVQRDEAEEEEQQQQQEEDQEQDDPPQDATTSSRSRRKDPAAEAAAVATTNKNKSTTTAQYLVQEYGGYAKSAVQVVQKKVKSVILANSFLRHLSKRSLLTRISSASHDMTTNTTNKYAGVLLPEFLELDAHRQQQVAHMLSWDHLTNSITTFDVFGLQEITHGNALLFVGWALLASPDAQIAMRRIVQGKDQEEDADDLHKKGYKFSELISNWSTESLIQFLRAVQEEYHADNPYHNALHAADVLQTTHVVWQRRLSVTAASASQDSNTTTTLDGFALLVAAAVHDVGHPGTNNLYQVHTQTELAQVYNDQSVLEHMHASKGFQLIRQHLGDWWSGGDPQYRRLRRLMIPAILHTDMAQHFELVAEVKGLLRCNDNNMNVDDDKYLYYILHLADISNPCKATCLATQWTDRILQECFAQGDAEVRQGLFPVSPLCDRNTTAKAASQVGFLQYIVLPSVQVLNELCPVDEWVDQLQVNLAYWKERQEKEQQNMSTSNSSHETATTVSETEADEDEP